MQKTNALSLLAKIGYQIQKYSTKRDWSPIAKAFNSDPVRNHDEERQGLCGIHALKSPRGFQQLELKCISRVNRLMKNVHTQSQMKEFALMFDAMIDDIHKLLELTDMVQEVHPKTAYKVRAKKCSMLIDDLRKNVYMDQTVYDNIRYATGFGDASNSSIEDVHVTKLMCRDFEKYGTHLFLDDPALCARFMDLVNIFGRQFTTAASKARPLSKSALPESVRQVFSGDDKSVYINDLYSDFDDPLVRQWAYKGFYGPHAEQEKNMMTMLQHRLNFAEFLSYNSYIDWITQGSLGEGKIFIKTFLHILAYLMHETLEESFMTINALKTKYRPITQHLAPWDVTYYVQKIQKDWFQIDANAYSPYFSLGVCMEGFNMVMTNLFGISFTLVNMPIGEAWHEKVYKLEVIHEKEGSLGFIYCDFFARKLKKNKNCYFTIHGGKDLYGRMQKPTVAVILNFPQPKGDPLLLTTQMIDDLFYQMGHAMRIILARQSNRYAIASSYKTDYSEVNSHLMQLFANDPHVLKTFARHFETQEPIPDDLVKRLIVSKHIFIAPVIQKEVLYALVDYEFHERYPLKEKPMEILARMQKMFRTPPHLENVPWHLRFSDLYDKGGIYYSHPLSRALATWIWRLNFKQDPLNRKSGEYYRKHYLAHGVAKPPFHLFSRILNNKVTPIALADSLVMWLMEKSSKTKR